MKSLKCHADRTSNDLEAFEVLSEILERALFSETKKRANFLMMELKDVPIDTDGHRWVEGRDSLYSPFNHSAKHSSFHNV